MALALVTPTPKPWIVRLIEIRRQPAELHLLREQQGGLARWSARSARGSLRIRAGAGGVLACGERPLRSWRRRTGPGRPAAAAAAAEYSKRAKRREKRQPDSIRRLTHPDHFYGRQSLSSQRSLRPGTSTSSARQAGLIGVLMTAGASSMDARLRHI